MLKIENLYQYSNLRLRTLVFTIVLTLHLFTLVYSNLHLKTLPVFYRKKVRQMKFYAFEYQLHLHQLRIRLPDAGAEAEADARVDGAGDQG